MAKTVGFDVIEFAGSINDRTLQHKLKADIREGLRLRITGTPGYLINGKVYMGHIPADIIDSIRE